MVAQTIQLPNIRQMIIPDPGYIMCDCDLAQADAQVVAWEANDDELKYIFKNGLDLHLANAAAIFKLPFGLEELHDPVFVDMAKEKYKKFRDRSKAGVHATNYGASAFTLAVALGITKKEAEKFIDDWFTAHPGIADWHLKVENDLQTKRMVTNQFGNRKLFFGRLDNAFPEALAWIPQSTVALIISHAMLNTAREVPECQMLFQVHDSLIFQLPYRTYRRSLRAMENCFKVVVPYEDELIIPAGPAVSRKSWGDVKDCGWDGKWADPKIAELARTGTVI